tara:strand:- start:289 stop:609 length:321 start_codon:yes stop_codon:yes gene_type:complete
MVGSNSVLFIVCYFLFKTLPAFIAGGTIYLGYKLFVMGVTGEASLSVETNEVSGQLLNAAPGLFFAVGGIIALIIVVWKGVKIKFLPDSSAGGSTGGGVWELTTRP